MPLLARVTTTTLSASFSSTASFGGEALLEARHYGRPCLLEVRFRLAPIVAIAIPEIAQRELGAVVGQRLEIQIHEGAQRPDGGNRRRRVPLEHELLHRPHAVDLAPFAAARAFRRLDAEPQLECTAGPRLDLRRLGRPKTLDALRRGPRLPDLGDGGVDRLDHDDVGSERLG